MASKDAKRSKDSKDTMESKELNDPKDMTNCLSDGVSIAKIQRCMGNLGKFGGFRGGKRYKKNVYWIDEIQQQMQKG